MIIHRDTEKKKNRDRVLQRDKEKEKNRRDKESE